MAGYLDSFFALSLSVYRAGVLIATRRKINLGAMFTVVDNPSLDAVDIAIGPGAGLIADPPLVITDDEISISPATESDAGSLSAADKTKLDELVLPLTGTVVTQDGSPHSILSVPIAEDQAIAGRIRLIALNDGGQTLNYEALFAALRVGAGAAVLAPGAQVNLVSHSNIFGVSIAAVSTIASGAATSIEFAVNSGGANLRWTIEVALVSALKPPPAP